jgi:hypothetical protein
MVCNTAQSRKAKGRKLQQQVRDVLREKYKAVLEDDDIESRGMGQHGTDIILSPLARKTIPFDIEIKCQEKLNIWDSIKQAETNTIENRKTLLIFKRNRTETYCALKFEDLLKFL